MSIDTDLGGFSPHQATQTDALMPVDVSGFSPVTLPEVMQRAAQLTRVDRKYVIPVPVAQAVVNELRDTHRLLVIDGRPSTTYRSTYFDTPDLETARAHVQGRRRRWKARSRLYVEEELGRLEVKLKDTRGTTAKSVIDQDPAYYGTLRQSDKDFIDEVLRAHSLPAKATTLQPTAEVTYHRVTLADLEQSTRVTLDWDVTSEMGGNQVWVDHDFLLLETKGGPRPGLADRVLAEHRMRPSSFSKYVAGVALLRDDVHANDFLTFFGHQLHCSRDPHWQA